MSIEISKQTVIHAYHDYDSKYGVWGWCTLDKAGCLIDYVNEICSRVEFPKCVEIGVYGGKSILPVALELKRHKKGIVYAIDPWSNEEATKGYSDLHYNFWSTVDLNRVLNIFRGIISDFQLEPYVNIVRSTSDDAPEYQDIDLLYIDGQHTEQALKDASKYATQVKKDGYCLVDDVNWGVVGNVPDYLRTLGFQHIHTVDQCQVFKRTFKYDFPSDFDWADFRLDQISCMKREIITESAYRFWNDVKEGDVVVDIGASVGPWTTSILDKKPKKVYCVEPSSNFIKSLEKNCRSHLNELYDDTIVCVNKAIVNNEQDYVDIFGGDKNYTTLTFKKFIEDNKIDYIDFLKIDCEGGEYNIFTDQNIDFLINNVGFISMEIHFNGEGFREKFKYIRNNYFKKFGDYKVMSCTTQNINYGVAVDLTDKIWNDKFIDEYQLEIMLYIKNDKKLDFVINDVSKAKGTVWVVDNFYEDPHKVREFALQQEFFEGGIGRGFIGRRTVNQFLFSSLKEKFENIMGKKITKWQEYDMNGKFQVAWSGEPLVWHCDAQQWGGMLYLTPDAPYQCGTTLYANKKTRARTYFDPGWDIDWSNVPGDPHLDGTPWEPVDVMGNVFNRLVIFDASAIHSASEYFGTVKENARLWQMFFFDAD